MEWMELKDWKVIGAIITAIGGIIAFILNRPRESAETIKAKAEAKKIHREIQVSEHHEIDELRRQLNSAEATIWDLQAQLKQAQKVVETLQRKLNVYDTFKSYYKK